MLTIADIRRRCHRMRPVLFDAWPALVVILGVGVALDAGYWFAADPVMAVAWAGVFLQWGGLIIVAIGIMKLRRQFKRGWFKRLWEAVQPPRNTTIHVGAGSIAATSQVHSMSVAHAHPTIEQRIEQVESQLKEIRTELATQIGGVNKSITELKNELEGERQERAGADRNVSQQLEDITAGGLHLEGIGLWWLMLGVFFTSVPAEAAGWIELIRVALRSWLPI